MLNLITRIALVFGGIYAVYRYRYQIFNRLFGIPTVRRFFIGTTMKIPYVRNRMIHQAFR
ncbi:hypothetical protein ACLM5H_02115 [Fredinandcohnia humi]